VEVRGSLEKLDKTLVEALDRSARKMHYQLGKITKKAASAELRRNEQLSSDARDICTLLFPEKNLQERELAGIYFLAKHGLSLISELVDGASTQCPGHQVLYI
jgi:glucan phosphorylase